MRLGIDATPLLNNRTGIGTYVEHLLAGLLVVPNEERPRVTATTFSRTGGAGLHGHLPEGVAVRARRVPARALQASWRTLRIPGVEWLCGRQDVFHATNFVLPPLGTARGVLTVHDLSFLRYPETVTADTLRYRWLVPDGIRRAEVITTLTQSVADEIATEYRTEPEKIIVASPGVDEHWFDVAPLTELDRQRLGVSGRYLLAVGTLEPRKNLRTLVAGYRCLLDEQPDAPPLVLVGGSGWGADLDLTAFPAGAVITPGYLPAALLRRVVAAAVCLAFPSVYEGFGLPPVEALACATPVLASDLPVTREVLGGAADLIEPRDVDAWTAGLRRALDETPDPARREARIAQARRWTWANCLRANLRAYRAALR